MGILAFLTPEARNRAQALLNSKRGRAKWVSSLAHSQRAIRKDVRIRLPVDVTADRLLTTLRSEKAPDLCLVLSENASLHENMLELSTVLQRVIGRGLATFVSCIPGQLAYLEGEEPNSRYVLQRVP